MENNPNQSVDIQGIKRDVLIDLEKVLATWNRMAKSLQTLVVIMGIISVSGSLYVSAFTDSEFLNSTWTRILSLATTLCLTLITTFNLSTKANNARNAWRHLNRSLYSFKSNRISVDELIKAYDEGEKILGDVTFNFPATTKKG